LPFINAFYFIYPRGFKVVYLADLSCLAAPYETNIFIGQKRSNISDFIWFNLSSVNHPLWNTNQHELTQSVCCFISIQAPSGGRKQNCRLFLFIPLLLQIHCFSTVLLSNMFFNRVLQTSEEHLD